MLNTIRRTINHWLLRFAERQAEKQLDGAIGAMTRGFDPVAKDGVDYSQPVLMPQYLREELEKEGSQKLQEYTIGAYQQATAFQFDSPYKTDLPFMPVTEDPLREWAWPTRMRVLSTTHSVYERNPIARQGVRLMNNMTIGEGFRLTTKCHEVEEVLEEFINSSDNKIRQYERQVIPGQAVDGELILRFFVKDGKTVCVPMRPWELRYIETELGFFRRPENYQFMRYVSQGDMPAGTQQTIIETVPADEILFVPFNNHAYELRGRPILYVVLPWLKAYKDWLENRARVNYWRSVLAWLVQVANPNASVIAAVTARWAQPPRPGSVAVESDKVNVTPLTNPIGAGDAAEDGRQLKLMTAVGMGLPEYMLSDGQNSNRATSNSQELPALSTFGELQRVLIEELWTPLFRRVIQNAVDAGLIPEYCDECDADGDLMYEDDEELETPDDADYMSPDGAKNMDEYWRKRWREANGASLDGGTAKAAPVDDAERMPPPLPEDDFDELPNEAPEPPAPKVARKIKAIDAFEVSYKSLEQYDIQSVAQAFSIATTAGFASKQSAAEKLGLDWAQEKKNMEREEDADRAERAEHAPLPPDALGMPPTPPPPAPVGTPGMLPNTDAQKTNDTGVPQPKAAQGMER